MDEKEGLDPKPKKTADSHTHGGIKKAFKIMHLPEPGSDDTIAHTICLVCGQDITDGLEKSALILRRDPLAF